MSRNEKDEAAKAQAAVGLLPPAPAPRARLVSCSKRAQRVGASCLLLCLLHAGLASAADGEGDRRPAGKFDLTTIPFSRAGSYMAMSRLPAADQRPAGIYLRTVRAYPAHQNIFILEPLESGRPVAYVERTAPHLLTFEAKSGAKVELIFSEPAVLRVRGRGLGLRLRMATVPPVNSAYPGEGSRWVINNSPNGEKFIVTPLSGRVQVDAPWNGVKSERIVVDLLPDERGHMEAAVEEYVSAWDKRDYPAGFDDEVARVEREFATFAKPLIDVEAPYVQGAELAAYLLWSNLVAPQGNLPRTSMFMSKNLMVGVWSWDHCFNAMALAKDHPQLAWDQLMMFFDLQNSQGSLPDRVNDRMITWAHNKPPVHGWALRHMMRANPFFSDKRRLREIYQPLARWTDWWFRYRDDDHDGLPQYNHGNDSGWDNATPFLAGVPLETPDLPAFLILQMDALADIAQRIGKAAEAKRWKSRGDELLARMLKAYWRDGRFIATKSGDAKEAPAPGDSLILYLPIVLGRRLPDEIRERLMTDLRQEGRFLTKHGLATESVRSKYYEADGYWRGPIWAPSTMLFVDGITASGDAAFAQQLSRRFADALARSQMPENFDAQTAQDRRDPGYTWTSSVYLMLAPRPSKPNPAP